MVIKIIVFDKEKISSLDINFFSNSSEKEIKFVKKTKKGL